MKDILLFCKKYMKLHCRQLCFYILLCIILGCFSLATPYVSGNFVDYLITGNSIGSLLQYCALYLSLSLGSVLLGYISNKLFISLQTRMGFELNRDVISHIQHLPLSFIEAEDTAYLNQKANNDSNALMTFCISIIQSIVINFVTILLSFLVIFFFNPLIAVSLFILIPCYFIVYQILKKKLFTTSFKFKEKQAEYFSKLFEQISHIKQLKVNALCSQFIYRLNSSFDHVFHAAIQYQKISYIFTGLDSIILCVAHIFLFLYGGILVLEGKLSVGQFTIISSYFSIMLTSTRYFFSLGKNVQDIMVSFKRITEILERTPDPIGSIELTHISKIALHNYSKRFGQKYILNSVSAEFEEGKIYVIAGPNGSGKTTLINSILGLYTNECADKIFYNEYPIGKIDLPKIYQNLLGIVEQEPLLFEDTIYFNITLGSPPKEKGIIDYYTNLFGLDGFINSLPNKMNTIVGENASNLSGGEKQKICLIRALIKNPNVLVLDEPTSALDKESVKAFKDYLTATKKGKITVIVTHDRSLNDIADVVISLPNSM